MASQSPARSSIPRNPSFSSISPSASGSPFDMPGQPFVYGLFEPGDRQPLPSGPFPLPNTLSVQGVQNPAPNYQPPTVKDPNVMAEDSVSDSDGTITDESLLPNTPPGTTVVPDRGHISVPPVANQYTTPRPHARHQRLSQEERDRIERSHQAATELERVRDRNAINVHHANRANRLLSDASQHRNEYGTRITAAMIEIQKLNEEIDAQFRDAQTSVLRMRQLAMRTKYMCGYTRAHRAL